jgi:hypothetical protein
MAARRALERSVRMTFRVMDEWRFRGIPQLEFAREGNVILVGQFPTSFSECVSLTGGAAWRLYMYQANLVKRRWRCGDSLPRATPDEPFTAQISFLRKENLNEAK